MAVIFVLMLLLSYFKNVGITRLCKDDPTAGVGENMKFTQVILEFYTKGIPDSGWVHVSYDPANLKCQALTAVKQDGKTVYLPGLVV